MYLVHGAEVDTGLLLALTSTEESDAGDSRGDGAAEGGQGGAADLDNKFTLTDKNDKR